MENPKIGEVGGGGKGGGGNPPSIPSAPSAVFEKTTLDIDGWHEKLLRRTKSQTTVHAYDRAVKRFEQFVGERMGLSFEDAVDRLRSKETDVYRVLDIFVGWASSLEVRPNGSEKPIQLVPNTIHR